MTTHIVNTHEAKSRLSELIRAAEQGADVIVARNGHPVAKIIPWKAATAERTPGAWSGQVSYADDPVASDADIVAIFDESAAAEMT